MEPAAALLSDEEVAFQQVVNSGALRKASSLRRVLTYLWENRRLTLSEYSIAVDALDRRPDFDPRLDATVRVHITRLRSKLKEYYETEGAGSAVILSIPAGSYQLEIQRLEDKPATPLPLPPVPSPAAAPVPSPANRWRLAAAITTVVALLSAGLATYYSRQINRLTAQAEFPRFWNAFLANGKPVKLVIPTPVFFSWPTHNLRVRDIQIDDFDAYRHSPDLSRLAKEIGPPVLYQSYNVTSDTIGALRLIQFFAPRGRYVEVVGAGTLSIELFGDHNLIFLGIPHTSAHLRRFLDLTNFAMEGNFTVLNRHPRPGEPRSWDTPKNPGFRQRLPGIIALLPGQAPGTYLLLVSGGHAASLVSFLISPGSLRTLDELRTKNGSPEHFEVVVVAELENHAVVRAQAVAFRPVSASLWK